jgi:hypothetical protein
MCRQQCHFNLAGTILGTTADVCFAAASLLAVLCADVFEFVLVFVVVHLLSPERAAALPPEIR